MPRMCDILPEHEPEIATVGALAVGIVLGLWRRVASVVRSWKP